jgi:hypothetical protein
VKAVLPRRQRWLPGMFRLRKHNIGSAHLAGAGTRLARGRAPL